MLSLLLTTGLRWVYLLAFFKRTERLTRFVSSLRLNVNISGKSRENSLQIFILFLQKDGNNKTMDNFCIAHMRVHVCFFCYYMVERSCLVDDDIIFISYILWSSLPRYFQIVGLSRHRVSGRRELISKQWCVNGYSLECC